MSPSAAHQRCPPPAAACWRLTAAAHRRRRRCPPPAAGVPGVTWEKFFLANLLPVKLGNIVAGSLCMATVYSLAYGSLGKKVWKQ